MSQLPKTNLEKWRYYLKDINSPDSYIDMAFYFMISSSLQRRVWLNPEEFPIFPNLYIILVGEPGVGKGMVIKPLMSILKYHKMNSSTSSTSELQAELERTIKAATLQNGQKQNRVSSYETPLLIPCAPDAITYEDLVATHARSTRFINTKNPSRLFAPKGKYLHNSLCFVLEEISSLFKKKHENITKYLLNAYDCGDYEYSTKTQGKDLVKFLCLNLLGGTTPSFVQDAFDAKIFEDGLSARTIFVFEDKPRHNNFGIFELNEEQIECKAALIAHVKSLTSLFGQLSFTEEGFAFLKNYFENILPNLKRNANEKLKHYYSKKNIIVQKLATAIHFSDQAESFVISLETVKKAFEILDHLEARMHLAFTAVGDTVFTRQAKKIERFIERKDKVSFNEIWVEFMYKEMDVIDILNCLVQTGKISIIKELNETSGKELIYYSIKKI